MPEIHFPDGKKISFSKKIDGFEIANKISKTLAKEACIMSVDGELKDLSFIINKRVKVKIITTKEKAKMDQLIEQTVTEAFRFAEESPFQMPDDAYQDVFASGIS